MIVIAGVALGAAIGATTARNRNGNLADMAQYAAGYSIAFGLAGLFATLALTRLL